MPRPDDRAGWSIQHPLVSGLGGAFPRTPEADVGGIAERLFGISPESVHRLATERDDTFRLSLGQSDLGNPGDFVLKIAHPEDDPLESDLPAAAIDHAAAVDPSLPLQRFVPPLVEPVHRGRAVRLVRYVPGRLLGETPTDESGVRKVGRMLGRLTSALSGFSHPAAERWLAWDLRHLDELVGLLPTVEGIDRRKVLSAELDALGAETLPALRETRVQVVHNDFHGGNLVVDPEAPDFVTGILDFGDVVRSHPAADLAIAMSYAGSYSAAAGDPWAPADALAAGYRETAELTDDEAALLRPLVLGRLVQRMLLGSWLAASRPENADYTGRNITSTWRQIESLRQSPATRRAPGK